MIHLCFIQSIPHFLFDGHSCALPCFILGWFAPSSCPWSPWSSFTFPPGNQYHSAQLSACRCWWRMLQCTDNDCSQLLFFEVLSLPSFVHFIPQLLVDCYNCLYLMFFSRRAPSSCPWGLSRGYTCPFMRVSCRVFLYLVQFWMPKKLLLFVRVLSLPLLIACDIIFQCDRLFVVVILTILDEGNLLTSFTSINSLYPPLLP